MLNVQRVHPKSKLPTRGSLEAAGYDLYSVVSKTVQPGERAMVSLGIIIQVPQGTYGRIAPRSGLAVKQGIDVLAGVVDRDYRGDVNVVLINHGHEEFHISVGDRIAQLVLEKIECPEAVEACLDETRRGQGGFGSTG